MQSEVALKDRFVEIMCIPKLWSEQEQGHQKQHFSGSRDVIDISKLQETGRTSATPGMPATEVSSAAARIPAAGGRVCQQKQMTRAATAEELTWQQ